MKRQTLALALSLVLVSRAAIAMERGGMVDSNLTNLQVTKIALQAADHKVIVTLEETPDIVIIPQPPIPYPPPPGPVTDKVQGGGDGPKPLHSRAASYRFELDTENPADTLTFQLLLKAYGSWSPVSLTLDGKGQIATVELDRAMRK